MPPRILDNEKVTIAGKTIEINIKALYEIVTGWPSFFKTFEAKEWSSYLGICADIFLVERYLIPESAVNTLNLEVSFTFINN